MALVSKYGVVDDCFAQGTSNLIIGYSSLNLVMGNIIHIIPSATSPSTKGQIMLCLDLLL